MGIAANVTGKIARYFQQDKESAGTDLKRGTDYSRVPVSGAETAGYHQLNDELRLDNDLMARYVDYENIGEYGEASAALDVYADDATTKDMTRGAAIWVNTKDAVIKAIVDDLLYKRLRVEEDLWPATRVLCLYGNLMAEVLASDKGVVGLNYLPSPTVRRAETKRGDLIGFVQDIRGQFNISNEDVARAVKGLAKGKNSSNERESPRAYGHISSEAGYHPKSEEVTVFQPWEMVHWRLNTKHVRSPYGQSVLEPARWIFPRLAMFEDSALLYRLTRSPARYAYYVDVGELPPGQAMAYVESVKRKYKKQQRWNPSKGVMGLRNSPMGMNEDLWLPMRGGQESTRVDVLSGPDYQVIDDLQYFRDKFFSAIRVPRAYLGFEADSSRQSLSNIDVRFAKAIMRIQQQLVAGFEQVVRTHLAILGIDPDVAEWSLEMKLPSHIFELAQIELMGAKMDVAERMREWTPRPWILERILGFSADQAQLLVQAKDDEDDTRSKEVASTQQDIAEKFPLSVGMEDENAPGAGAEGEPSAEAVRESVKGALDRLEKRIDAKDGKMTQRLEELSKPVKDMQRDIRMSRIQQKPGLRRVS